jgi:hypothetical protein
MATVIVTGGKKIKMHPQPVKGLQQATDKSGSPAGDGWAGTSLPQGSAHAAASPSVEAGMTMRTAHTSVTFTKPFALSELGTLPAGTYTVETVEELLPTLMTQAFHRVSTFLHMPRRTDGSAIVAEVASIDFHEFAEAHMKDVEDSTSEASARESRQNGRWDERS